MLRFYWSGPLEIKLGSLAPELKMNLTPLLWSFVCLCLCVGVWLTLGLHMSYSVKHLKAEPEKICCWRLCFAWLIFVIMQKHCFAAYLCSLILMSFSLLIVFRVTSLYSSFCFCLSLVNVNDSDSVDQLDLLGHKPLCALSLGSCLYFTALQFALSRKFS